MGDRHPILDVWSALPPRDFPNYEAGTWGPDAANALIEGDGDGHKWFNPGAGFKVTKK